MTARYPEQYYEYFRKFNAGEYYECHDLLEELWMVDRSNKFLQGMLQLAVAIYHFECGNIKGSRWMFQNARKYLVRYTPVCWDLRVDQVIEYIDHCLSVLPQVDSLTIEEVKQCPFPYRKLSLGSEETD